MMKTKVSLIAMLLVSSFCFLACNEDDDLTPDMPHANKATTVNAGQMVEIPKFVAPTNANINALKARQYADASVALVLLGQQWSLRIEKAPDQEKIKILSAYERARDQVCANLGLAGIAEYNWITTVAMNSEDNQDLFAKVGIKVSQ
ncbi:MAG: hypothetical protein WCX75_00285 [Fibrobacteraceae bacterium]